MALVSLAICALLAVSSFSAPPAPPGGKIVRVDLNDVIHPISSEYVNRAFDEAEASKAALVLIRIDTPGGYDSSMREIIARIINSPVPVAIYVGPSGARAASAGFYILQAADVAAMAPGTHTGAASPVLINILTGATVPLSDTMQKKIINDATAYLRSIVTKRGRNVPDAESTITEARAYTAEEALKRKMVDLLADSEEALLMQLDGREITRFDGRKETLSLHGIRENFNMTGRQRFLSRILSPDVFFILLIVGVLGLFVEFNHPGFMVPGIVGGICLLLALFAMNILPVSVMGILLIVLALALFILEAKYTSHGILGLGGVVAMLLGALVLIRSPWTGAGVSLEVALGVTLPFALLSVFLMQLVLRSRKGKLAIGQEQMPGTIVEVTQAIQPDAPGQVSVLGETWRAEAQQVIAKGEKARIARVEGLTVHVVPVSPGQFTQGS
ncbi:MAG: nodulation protein NfeD [Acidobacteria bacterium]|nr:nodulation protein NfeD [Acidobacteriota bacterium]